MFADLFTHQPLLPSERLLTDLMRMIDRTVNTSGTAIPLSVETQDREYLLTLFVPGCKAEDILVEVEENEVTIQGRRSVAIPAQESDGITWHRRERSSREWRQSIAMPGAVDSRSARAELADGVLTVHLTRIHSQEPRSVPVTHVPTSTPVATGAEP
jgi:HSP20 family molecular chaperone IbpA